MLKGSAGITDKIISALLVMTSLIYLYTAGFGSFSSINQRAILLALLIPVIFLRSKSLHLKSTLTMIISIMAAVLIVLSNIYLMIVWQDKILISGATSNLEIVIGTIVIILLLEATRRATGMFLTLTAIFFIIYAIFGPYFPGFLVHKGLAWDRLVSFLFMTTEGIYGIPLGIASTFIIVFVIFGAFLEAFGGGEWFVDVSYAIAGRFRGGPAKTSILASALMGMISGSPAANVSTVGTFTIPLMKKVGYKPYIAGAIESVASTGGMFTPPVMGAAAFIMAEYLNVSYLKICIAAIMPAFLYYFALMLVVDAQAVKNGLKGLPACELPKIKDVMSTRGYLGIPIVFMITVIILGWSPMKAAFYSTVLSLFVAFLGKATRPDIHKVLKALENGAKGSVEIVATCAVAGIIVGIISVTGLGAKLSYTLIQYSHGNMYLAAFLAAIVSLILGCAMPPTAVYIIVVSILVPPLTKLGITPIAAHMFLFLFSCVGAITPPVAIAAYTGAAIAQADPSKTGFTAFRYGLVAYIIPFMFISNPTLILQGNMDKITVAVLFAIIGVICLAAAIEGQIFIPWNKVSRVCLGIAALLTLYPEVFSSLVGLGLIMLALIINKVNIPQRSLLKGIEK
ncbi:TRAP transporter permease [Moorella sulfitireducens]|uniref:TRAP transporter permease n=1 Tax=Neomoorella sulfitireducens TaxID=2972948 RepID=UPI0021AD1E39|nr:TRAP transporter permease [Moorella sulfitireducens]